VVESTDYKDEIFETYPENLDQGYQRCLLQMKYLQDKVQQASKGESGSEDKNVCILVACHGMFVDAVGALCKSF
jgi:hypothetical protein